MKLFDLPSLATPASVDAARYQALGVSAQLLLTARLMELGHKIAVPVTDDDGVDLIVNYTTLVQVKSCASRTKDGVLRVALHTKRASERQGRSKAGVRDHVDIIAVYARDSRTWWFVPRATIGTNLLLSEHTPDPRREAWHTFDLEGGYPMGTEEAA